MNYYRVQITAPPDLLEVLLAFLSERAFESFEEQDGGIAGYIREESFDTAERTYLRELADTHGLNPDITLIPGQNWNEVWESNFHPVRIRDFCAVRASFHPAQQGVRHELVIDPRMAFGTGHHETTSMVMEAMQDIGFIDKQVLDYGCGTGILAILASRLGAGRVLAIDNDPEACRNSLDNIRQNKADRVEVRDGDLSVADTTGFDVILANINRHIILAGFPWFQQNLTAGGVLLCSGFLTSDSAMLVEAAQPYGLHETARSQLNGWAMIRFGKSL